MTDSGSELGQKTPEVREDLGTAVETLRKLARYSATDWYPRSPMERQHYIELSAAEAQAILDVLPRFDLVPASEVDPRALTMEDVGRAAQPKDWLVPCQHCERGNVVSLHPDGSVWVNGLTLEIGG